MLRQLANQPYFRLAILSLITIVLYLAALNRPDQNLSWLMASLLLALLIISWTGPLLFLRRLAVTRNAPLRAEEDQWIELELTVNNRAAYPCFMIEIADHLPFVQTPQQQPYTLGLLSVITAQQTQHFKRELLCELRGCYQLGPVALLSSFPLGLWTRHYQAANSQQTLIIYPSLFHIEQLPLTGCPSELHRGSFLLAQAHGNAEFCGLREYRRGDHPRHIHWPSSARLNQLMVKEFEPLASACLYLVLDVRASNNLGQGKQACFEYAIKIAASMAQYAQRTQMPVALYSSHHWHEPPELASGDAHFRHLLDQLAVIAANGEHAYAEVLLQLYSHTRPGQTVVIFVSETATDFEQTLAAIALLMHKGVHLLAITFDRASFGAEATDYAALSAWPIPCFSIACYDNLFERFNP